MKVGLQMYSVRGEMAADPLAATQAVIDIGYKYLEYANLTDGDLGIGYDVSPTELRSILAEEGAEAVSTHLWGIDESAIDELIAFHQELGTKYLVSKFLYRNLNDIVEMAEQFVRVGDRIREAGFRHAIHNGLLRSQDGRTDLDELLDRVPADLIDVELDTYWVYRSGLDPIELLKRHGERIRLVHQKDLPAVIEQPVNIIGHLPADAPLTADADSFYFDRRYIAPDNFVEVGDGVLPLPETIDVANRYCNAEYLFVEQDFTALTELESVARSFDHITKQPGIASADGGASS